MLQVAQFSDHNDKSANFNWVISTQDEPWSTPWGKFYAESISERIKEYGYMYRSIRFYKLDCL